MIFSVICFGQPPRGYPYTASNQAGNLDSVITQLRLQQVNLVAHDASGPPAIDGAHAASPASCGARAAEHILLCNAGAPVSRSDLAVLDSGGSETSPGRCHGCFRHWIFRRMHQWQVRRFFNRMRRSEMNSCHGWTNSSIRRQALGRGFLSLEGRLIAHHQIAHKNDPKS